MNAISLTYNFFFPRRIDLAVEYPLIGTFEAKMGPSSKFTQELGKELSICRQCFKRYEKACFDIKWMSSLIFFLEADSLAMSDLSLGIVIAIGGLALIHLLNNHSNSIKSDLDSRYFQYCANGKIQIEALRG